MDKLEFMRGGSDHEPAPATVYQRIVTTFNEHLGKVCRVRAVDRTWPTGPTL
ncbi:hypothetical protein ACFTZ8_09120 [Streptomyces fungicidicus]|uniref:hypothetical protein n=1 Tax=Streptomyces fungicidicus TaxID=68203 RepID=UPI00340981DB